MHIASGLELKVPPPVVGLAVAAVMWFASTHVPAFELAPAARVTLALAIAAAGFAFDIAGLRAFRRMRTTANPMTPQKSSALVAVGVYRITRNPMYLGLLLILSAWAVYLSSLWLLFGPLLFLLYIGRFQIAPEERALSARFGEEYEAYRKRVRRWL